jgi:hypothetical protein
LIVGSVWEKMRLVLAMIVGAGKILFCPFRFLVSITSSHSLNY